MSERDPAVTITFGASFEYSGGQRWDLLGLADAEQHLFVRPGEGSLVEALYWVQFERFLPTNEHTYDYARDWVVDIGGLEFLCDTRAYAGFGAVNRDPESDGAYAQRLLEGRGYEFPEAAVRLRAIHLPTPDRRSELMIIYAESMDAADVPEDGLVLGADSELAKETFQRAVRGMTLTRRE